MQAIRSLIAPKWSSEARLEGKTAIVTGANTGIGKETAKDLASRGARVILACRDMTRGEQAARDIMREVVGAKVVARQLDLADTKSICQFAENVYNTEKNLHYLINNAGVAICPYATTVDGYEMQFGVNHLGHFFLTFLLLDLLKHSAPSRVINVSSVVHAMGKIQFDDLNGEKNYHPVRAYAQSKLANVLFTRELAKRTEVLGVMAYAVDPGIVNTEIARHIRLPLAGLMKTFSFMLKSAAEGAYTIIYCTVTPENQLQTGGFYKDCRRVGSSRAGQDDGTALKLWAVSCSLLSILLLWRRSQIFGGLPGTLCVCCNRWSSEERLDGKTVIVTGANTGIGKETARDLAARGARIIMACRDLERAEEARSEILEDTGNENVVIRKLDLSDTRSIRAFAERINKEEKQVNILINNAGIMMCPYSKTVDGFEMQLGVNHLGHFLLTYLLLDLIKWSVPARIIVVASVAHTWTGLRLDDINSDSSYDTMKAYGQSKLANVLFARSLAKHLKGTGVSVFSLHPGVVQSDLWRHQHQCIQVAVKIFRIFTKTTVEGAQTTIYCAVQPGLEGQSGGYFSDCAPASCSRMASDDDLAQKLWEISCNMLGITWQ
ncbi:retinol dehydrogenase 12-like [Aulostomus maculatus]